jgi:hypothetical protein
MKKRFELAGKIVFEADDIANAYVCLSEYYAAMARGENSPSLIPLINQMRLRPLTPSSQGFPAVEPVTKKDIKGGGGMGPGP